MKSFLFLIFATREIKLLKLFGLCAVTIILLPPSATHLKSRFLHLFFFSAAYNTALKNAFVLRTFAERE